MLSEKVFMGRILTILDVTYREILVGYECDLVRRAALVTNVFGGHITIYIEYFTVIRYSP